MHVNILGYFVPYICAHIENKAIFRYDEKHVVFIRCLLNNLGTLVF